MLMGAEKHQEFIDHLHEISFSETSDAITAVPLECVFDGNDDEGSIGCNLYPHPGLASLFTQFAQFRDNPIVRLYIEIHEMPSDSNSWLYAERAYAIGDVDRAAVEALHAQLVRMQ